MSSFKPVQIEALPKKASFLSQEQLNWKQYSLPATVKDSALIQHVDIASEEPFQFAISSSNRVQIYNPASRDITCRLTKFKLNAFGATFRGDNKLLAAGSDEGTVKLFDIKTKAVLRQFIGHKRPTRRVTFANKGQHVVSFSDDTTVAVWDIPQQAQILSMTHHEDYVRCGRVAPASTDLLLTASYDHSAALVDIRAGKPGLVVDHGAPIDAVEMLPSGSIFFTAGGNLIKIWDVASGRKLIQLCQHHKAITCLSVSSSGDKLLSGSLDRHVKVYDVQNYQVVHSVSYPSPILCMAMAQDASVFVVGSETGLVTIHRKKDTRSHDDETKVESNVRKAVFIPDDDDIVLDTKHFTQASKLQNQLRRFEFTTALKTAFAQATQCNRPELFMATCDEIARRRTLEQALEKIDEKHQNAILDFICKYVTLPRYEHVLLDLIEVMTRVLQKRREWDDVLWLKLKALAHQIDRLHATQNECQKLVAMIETLSTKNRQNVTAQPMTLDPI
ncbi:U3 small nucleolar RNA-associated protein 15-like [Tropilaelaps mercedesae]|uniref:U3 small nucleolar RNA-associated protein 15 homolog n=1 Tax=Tropilaelaps mercedesae TaxID=418985 RepID=A0A1V9XPP8_9ACAR|nr:U3 small nucleolar RNA-associated protein 15-like [Tropilaelaps mercedesae]